MNKKKILFYINNLGAGGAERVLINILHYLDRDKFDPVLVLGTDHISYDSAIPSDVKAYFLFRETNPLFFLVKRFYRGLVKLVLSLPKLYFLIRRENPDIVLSFLEDSNTISLAIKLFLFRKPKFIISNRTYLSLYCSGIKGALYKILFRYLYPKADGVITVSKKSADDLIKHFRVAHEKIRVIYNPCDLKNIARLAGENLEHPFFKGNAKIIISVGRLEPSKGFSYLLEAFRIVLDDMDARLILLGEGRERKYLGLLAKKLNIGDKVSFVGFEKNPHRYISKCSVFALSSLFEGFPNVILEAMACGIPVVSTDCLSGPGEIIDNGVNGLLVPVKDPAALAAGLVKILSDEIQAKKMAENGRIRAQDFSIEKKVFEYGQYFKGKS